MGRLSFGFLAGWSAVAFAAAGWAAAFELPVDFEAQPHRTATATVETNKPIADIFFIDMTGFHFDCKNCNPRVQNV